MRNKKIYAWDRQDWQVFYKDLLVDANIQNFYNYFAKEHKIIINNVEFLNGAFIKRMEWFQTNDDVVKNKSKVDVINFFSSSDKKQISELHETTVYYKNEKKPRKILVMTQILLNEHGDKIKYFYDISFVKEGDRSETLKHVNKSND